jgi:hypothetical protein
MESLLIVLAVLLIIAVIVYYLPLPAPIAKAKIIAYIVLAVVAIVYLLRFAGLA